MLAQEIMNKGHLWAVTLESTCKNAAEMMEQHDVGSLPVVDYEGRVVGIITDRDLCCRVLARGLDPQASVSQVMTSSLHTVAPDADLDNVEDIMRRYQVRRVPVVDEENRLQGVVATADIFLHSEKRREKRKAAEVMEEVSQHK